MSDQPTQELMTSSTDKVPFFKKRTTKNIRKRQKSPDRNSSGNDTTLARRTDDSDDDIVSEVVTKERKTTKTPFIQSTRRKRQLRHTDTGVNNDKGEEDDDDDQTGFGDQYQADRSTTLRKDDATRYTTEFELDAEAVEAMTSAINAGKAKKTGGTQAHQQEKKQVKNSKLQVGPQKAPANLRVTARFDYQPDICKDYKGKEEEEEEGEMVYV